MRFRMSKKVRAHLRFRQDARRVLDRATHSPQTEGIDSIDLLAALLEEAAVVRLIDDLSGAAEPIKHVVSSRSREPGEGMGLSNDAKLVIEATTHLSLVKKVDPGVDDLLIGIATADCRARDVLNAHGITAERLLERVGSVDA